MEGTKIEWTDHTVNGWIGCAKVSPGCANCYAEAQDERWKYGGRTNWGVGGSRHNRVEAAIRELRRIAALAHREGRPQFVFLSSMCDVFEDHPEVPAMRARLWAELNELNRDSAAIVALLLTKRPTVLLEWQREVAPSGLPHWAWVGTSVENQEVADERVPVLLEVSTQGIRFLSMEPLLGPVDLENIAPGLRNGFPGVTNALTGEWWPAVGDESDEYDGREDLGAKIGWVIVGGESGPKARPMHPHWPLSIRDQCANAGVPFLFKQWGEWGTDCFNMLTGRAEWPMFDTHLRWVHKASSWVGEADALVDVAGRRCRNGGDMAVAVYPVAILVKRGKKAAGRVLDGRTHDDSPPAGYGAEVPPLAVPVSLANSLVDGKVPTARPMPGIAGVWSSLRFEDAEVDAGPSPSGNPGPYLKVPDPTSGTRHRVYPRPLARGPDAVERYQRHPRLIDGVWFWVPTVTS